MSPDHEIHSRLQREGRCALTLTRSNHGKITLSIRTHTLGMVDLELTADQLADLLFGVAETEALIARVNPRRTPTYPATITPGLGI